MAQKRNTFPGISPEKIIRVHKNLFLQPPAKTPANVANDGPLLGNGSLAAVIAGPPAEQTFYLSRNDFWRLESGLDRSYPAALGALKINIAGLNHAKYYVEQDLYQATIIAQFSKGDTNITITSWIAATKDWLVIEMENKGMAAVTGKVFLDLPGEKRLHYSTPINEPSPDTTSGGATRDGINWIQRGFVKNVTIKTNAVAGFKILGQTTNNFVLKPQQKIRVVCASSGNFKQANLLGYVQQQLSNLNETAIASLQQQHAKWWRAYWQESYVAIDDTVIEHQYYRSQYTMASCSRDPRFPPGLFGSWVTREIPAWNGDYHLNYNYQAPFYALYSSNHLQQALPYEAPLLDFMQRGAYYANKITAIGEGAVLYPVGIGPLGIETTDGLFLGQKSNAAYAALNLASQFYRTYDLHFTKRVYPFLKATAIFWQHYLKKQGERYVILDDAIHEGTDGDMNPVLSLALVRSLFQVVIDMGTLLKSDPALRLDLAEKLQHLSTYPTQTRQGKMVFRYTEKGVDWWNDNTLGIQPIYPAGQIGLESDSALLSVARNTVEVMQRWFDFNGSNSFFPAAVRVGYNPDTILAKLKAYSLRVYPNGFQRGNPHGIENCSTVPNTINEMLCMSNQGVLRVFAVWPRERDASFTNLRCEGAFLVSATLKDKQVQYVRVISEKGRDCHFLNPWPGQEMTIESNKRGIFKRKGDRLTITTLPQEQLLFYLTQH